MTCGRARGASGRLLLLLLLLLAAAVAVAVATAPDAEGSPERDSVEVTACLPGGERAGGALAELVARALAAGGLRARAVPPPAACRPPARADGAACLAAAQRALAAGRLAAALLPAPAAAAPSAWRLRDAGLDELGDAAPPTRRACWALPSPAPPAPPAPPALRSLLDLADAAVARHYAVPAGRLEAAARNANVTLDPISIIKSPEWCDAANATCATLLTSGEEEAALLLAAVREQRLWARVRPLGAALPAAARAMSAPAVVCGWALETTEFAVRRARPLGPPPCERDDCPFESRRLVKLVRAADLARSPAALRALLRLTLDAEDMRALTALARDLPPAAAARLFLEQRPPRIAPREVLVAVLLPDDTPREAYDGVALTAAAALAEEDLEAAGRPRGARLEVEAYDDRCDAARAYKYLSDALGTGAYGSLSAAAGPACGAAYADVARQSAAHALPVLAYSAQAPAAGARGLLAAGDARGAAAALAAWLAHERWRRVAVVSEGATRAAADTARLRVNVVEHLELADGETVDVESIMQWAHRVAAARGRIIYLCVEDARIARAALCAGRGAALHPARGAVWLLPAALRAGWWRPRAGDSHNCTLEELEDMADGHIALGFEWLVNWRNGATAGDAGERAWRARWRVQCGRLAGAGCGPPGPHAALLYDTLRLWAGALDRELAARPALDLHDPDVVSSLVTAAASADFVGVTGPFRWSPVDDNDATYARESPVVVAQWDAAAGALREVARWSHGTLAVRAEPHWRTAGGAAPDDGGDDCALRPLADLLGADCAGAFAALGAVLLALAVAAGAGAALHCRRRAERAYRAKLEALGLRALAAPAEPAGLDRWELPRERVVINRKLGMGAFGTVYGGHALLAEGRPWTAVAVKTLKPGASVDEKLDFLSEAEAMKRFDHRNVVRLLAVVTKTEPVCTVMEFMLYGDLKNYLLARRHLAAGAAGADGEEEGEEGEADEVSARRLTAMALDAARALGYLARLRYVHRDVAARNCLVSSRRVVKLADFGMTRLVFENDYYRFSRKGMLPVRWMAPESLALGVFSPASDVWSFGVLLYEIVTFGSLPFQGLSNGEVLARVKAGHTLDLPPGIDPQLEELILSCWRRERAARPAAAELAGALAAAPRLLQPCPDAPLDALPLGEPPWRLPPDRAQARWLSWGAPASQSQATDTTYLSDAAPPAPPRDTDRFLPRPHDPPDDLHSPTF